jgi:hypothetical protein
MTQNLTHDRARTNAEEPTTGDLVRVSAVLVLAVVQPMSSLLANLLPGDQPSSGTVSDRYAHVLTPAGYAFAIWGLIYLASFAFAVYQALPSQHARHVHRATGWWMAGAFAASTVWVPLFVSDALAVAQVVIVALVVFLAVALARVTGLGPATSTAEQWLVRMPISAYLGWATIATVAGSGTTAQWAGIELDEGTATALAATALVLLGALGAWIGYRVLAAAGFALLLAWGLVAVAVATPESVVAFAAVLAAVLTVSSVVVRAVRSSHPVAVLFG